MLLGAAASHHSQRMAVVRQVQIDDEWMDDPGTKMSRTYTERNGFFLNLLGSTVCDCTRAQPCVFWEGLTWTVPENVII